MGMKRDSSTSTFFRIAVDTKKKKEKLALPKSFSSSYEKYDPLIIH